MAQFRQLVLITSVLISHATSQMRQPKSMYFPFHLPFFFFLVRIEFLPTGKASSYFFFVLQHVNTRHQIYVHMYLQRYRICPFQESSIQTPVVVF